LKEEDHTLVDISTHVPTEVKKLLDTPAVTRPPARCVDFGAAADLMRNDTGGFGQEVQDEKEEDITRHDDRDKGDGITEEANDGLLNDDEVNGQERNGSHAEASRQCRTYNIRKKSFDGRIVELQSFKAKHGHVHVTGKQAKNLATFCTSMRYARRTGLTMTITEDRIKALDELGFDWGDKKKSFEERIEELNAFKDKHGHVLVTVKQDKSLAYFCNTMRCARRGTAKRTVIAEDRIKALDELGFDWGRTTKSKGRTTKKKSFDERIEELKAFKAKHGHVRASRKHDKSLLSFCDNMRSARRGKGTMTISDIRIKALDELDFEWGHQEIK